MLSVLLIDNESSILDMITIISEVSTEISVETARSANEGLKKLNDKSFDAIIVDYDMQGTTGFEFLKIIRSRGDTTPVILFTALGLEDRAIETVNNGAIFFLKKGENLQTQFRELISITKRAVTQTYIDQSLDTAQRIIAEMINFSSDPSFAIDPNGNVVAWNESMEQLTDVPAGMMIGRGGFAYAEPFFGARKKMLVDLVFASDEEIRNAKYMQISRVPKGTI
ncbi:MAG: response regulator, partial [Methanoregula sp.]|nr:response regulator [Methanoregula sp.]